jgi:uncharacterized protein (TIGR02646 family)
MIRVIRPAEPSYLAKRRTKWLAELREARRQGNKVRFKKLQGRYGHDEIKNALNAMFSSKCAYCESAIEVVATPHIEHFRPKQRYVSLTYAWNNLLLSCPKCNDGRHKGTKFPNSKQSGPLIDPSSEDPSIHLEFLYDSNTKLATVRPLSNRGHTTCTIFELNNRPALLKARSELLRNFLALKQFDGIDPEVTAILAEARNGGSAYLAWIKKYI